MKRVRVKSGPVAVAGMVVEAVDMVAVDAAITEIVAVAGIAAAAVVAASGATKTAVLQLFENAARETAPRFYFMWLRPRPQPLIAQLLIRRIQGNHDFFAGAATAGAGVADLATARYGAWPKTRTGVPT